VIVTKEKNTQLSEVQLAVMRALWNAGEATTAAVHEHMGKPRSLAYTTVATLLNRLEKRGLVISRKDARERVFEPVVTEDEVKRQMVSDLVAKLFLGDPRALVSQLVSDAEIDEGDLDTVRRMLADAKGNPNAGAAGEAAAAQAGPARKNAKGKRR
jgi:BlaI family transcriptional regulator, penicillinase repressor